MILGSGKHPRQVIETIAHEQITNHDDTKYMKLTNSGNTIRLLLVSYMAGREYQGNGCCLPNHVPDHMDHYKKLDQDHLFTLSAVLSKPSELGSMNDDGKWWWNRGTEMNGSLDTEPPSIGWQ